MSVCSGALGGLRPLNRVLAAQMLLSQLRLNAPPPTETSRQHQVSPIHRGSPTAHGGHAIAVAGTGPTMNLPGA